MSSQTVKSIDCQLGEVVNLPVDIHGKPYDGGASHHLVEARIIAIDTKDDMRWLGWKETPSNVHLSLVQSRSVMVNAFGHRLQTVPDFNSYTCGMWVNQKQWMMKISGSTSVSSSGTVINDHVCPSCGNTRVSKTEKSCWRCGNALH